MATSVRPLPGPPPVDRLLLDFMSRGKWWLTFWAGVAFVLAYVDRKQAAANGGFGFVHSFLYSKWCNDPNAIDFDKLYDELEQQRVELKKYWSITRPPIERPTNPEYHAPLMG
jgi:hypothetical protein